MYRLWIGASEKTLQRGAIYATLKEAVDRGYQFAEVYVVRIEIGQGEWHVFPQTQATMLGPGFAAQEQLAPEPPFVEPPPSPITSNDDDSHLDGPPRINMPESLQSALEDFAVREPAPPTAEESALAEPATDAPVGEPAPLEPAPLEPAPLEPAPLEPAPPEPAPFEPAPLEPAPLEPTPFESAPSETPVPRPESVTDDPPLFEREPPVTEPPFRPEPTPPLDLPPVRRKAPLTLDEWVPLETPSAPPREQPAPRQPSLSRPLPTKRSPPRRSTPVVEEPRPERRRARRVFSPMPAAQPHSITWDRRAVRLVNVSWTGARIATKPYRPPHAGEIIVVEVQAFGLVAHLAGQVRWVREGECGIAFDEALMTKHSTSLLERLLGPP